MMPIAMLFSDYHDRNNVDNEESNSLKMILMIIMNMKMGCWYNLAVVVNMARLAWEIFGQQARSGQDCNNTNEYDDGEDDNDGDYHDHDHGDGDDDD